MIMLNRKHPKVRKMLKVLCFFVYTWKNYRSFCFTKGEYINHRITCKEAWVLAEISTSETYEFAR